MVVTKVHRPCLMTERTQSTEVRRHVKGEAIEASPSFTKVGSCSCSCSSVIARAYATTVDDKKELFMTIG